MRSLGGAGGAALCAPECRAAYFHRLLPVARAAEGGLSTSRLNRVPQEQRRQLVTSAAANEGAQLPPEEKLQRPQRKGGRTNPSVKCASCNTQICLLILTQRASLTRNCFANRHCVLWCHIGRHGSSSGSIVPTRGRTLGAFFVSWKIEEQS